MPGLFRRLLRLIVFSILLTGFFYILIALSSIEIAPLFQPAVGSAKTKPVIYLMQNNQIEQLNINTGKRETLFSEVIPPAPTVATPSSNQIDRRIWKTFIDSNWHYLYLIEGWGHSADRLFFNQPTGTELIRVDRKTRERKTIFNSTTVFNLVLSPDQRHMAVFFYVGQRMYTIQQLCIMDLQTLRCPVLPFRQTSDTGYWLNNSSFYLNAVLPGDTAYETNFYRLIDAERNLYVTLQFPPELYVYWGVAIPMTTSLITPFKRREFGSSVLSISFLVFDLRTGSTEVLPFTEPDYRNFDVISNMLFSPDGKFLLYWNPANLGKLLEFRSGRLVKEFDAIYSPLWLDDQTLLIQGKHDGGEQEIFYIDAISGLITALYKGDNASGALFAP